MDLGKRRTVRANCRTVVSISPCRLVRPTGWANAWPASSAPVATVEVNFILKEWMKVMDDLDRRGVLRCRHKRLQVDSRKKGTSSGGVRIFVCVHPRTSVDG
jgi:hypothetical protein